LLVHMRFFSSWVGFFMAVIDERQAERIPDRRWSV